MAVARARLVIHVATVGVGTATMGMRKEGQQGQGGGQSDDEGGFHSCPWGFN